MKLLSRLTKDRKLMAAAFLMTTSALSSCAHAQTTAPVVQPRDASHHAAVVIDYRLPKDGQVSLNIYDGKGAIVRELLHAARRAAGANKETWDGNDRDGKPCPPGEYSWKLLETQGLKAKYLMSPASTLPAGPGWWEHGLGNHIGIASVAVDASGVYVAAGLGENTRTSAKFSPDMTKCLWSGSQPLISDGGFSIGLAADRVFQLTQEAYIAGAWKDKPNGFGQLLGTFDVLWAGDKRPDAGSHMEYPNPTGNLAMAASDNGGAAQLVVSYTAHNAIRWIQPDAPAGPAVVLDEAAVPAPRGICIQKDGQLLVISGKNIVRLSRQNKTPQTVVSGLTDPWRLTVDSTTGDILVLDLGSAMQVKRFSSSGKLLASYGKPGGRKDGLYHAEDFLNPNDIAADGAGGFYVCEGNSTPRRLAHFDRSGKLVKEWFTGTLWTPAISVDPTDASSVWVEDTCGHLMRCIINYATNTWRVHSTYTLYGLSPLISGDGGFCGGGYNSWRIKKHDGKTYLTRLGAMQVLVLDEKTWKLKPVAVGDLGGQGQGAWIWTDANGDGLPQESEYRRYPTLGDHGGGLWGWQYLSLDAPAGFEYFWYNLSTNQIYRSKPDEWNPVGAPVYGDFQKAANTPWGPPVTGLAPGKFYQNSPTIWARDSDGSLFGAWQEGTEAWGQPINNFVQKRDAAGNEVWRVGKRTADMSQNYGTPPPGEIHAFKRAVGVVHNCVVINDMNGGRLGSPQSITYVWDKDGLWVGGLFDAPDLTGGIPLSQYSLASDNGPGEVYESPKNGKVLYFGSWENESRVYRIEGWDGWVRQSGKLTLGPLMAGDTG